MILTDRMAQRSDERQSDSATRSFVVVVASAAGRRNFVGFRREFCSSHVVESKQKTSETSADPFLHPSSSSGLPARYLDSSISSRLSASISTS